MPSFDRGSRAIRRLMGPLLLIALPAAAANAQLSLADSCRSTTRVDMKDLLHHWLHHTSPKSADQPSEKKFQLVFLPAGGYSSNTGFAAAFGTNAVWTMPGSGKESSALTSLTYTQYRQTITPLLVSIWTRNDRFNIIVDDRYIDYPSSLYGLEGKPNVAFDYTVNFSWLKLHHSILARVMPNLYAGAGLYYDHYWNIREEAVTFAAPPPNARVGLGSAFEDYSGSRIPPTTETTFGPAFKVLYDSRDNPVNAVTGWYASVLYHPNFQSWGSDVNCKTVIVDARKYISLTQNKYNVLAFWAYYWANFGGAPFLTLPSTGWDDQWNTSRGFSQGRYRGSQMRYLESEYRFGITRNGLLGGVVFANVENFPTELYTSFSDYHGLSQASVTALGYGAGLRLKLNKCSRTNLCLDAGFGQQFPKPWLAINLGEVF